MHSKTCVCGAVYYKQIRLTFKNTETTMEEQNNQQNSRDSIMHIIYSRCIKSRRRFFLIPFQFLLISIIFLLFEQICIKRGSILQIIQRNVERYKWRKKAHTLPIPISIPFESHHQLECAWAGCSREIYI